MNAIRMCGSNVIRRTSVNEIQPRMSTVRKTSIENVDKKDSGVVSPSIKGKHTPKVKIPAKRIPRVVVPKNLPSPHKRCPIHVGKLYELDDGRFGQCMFLGPALFHKRGIWVGLQLENAEGKHNGTVDGRKYFLCREGKGIFVRPHRIRRLVTEVSNSHSRDKKVVKDPHRNRYIRKETIADLVELTTPTYTKRGLLELERRNTYRNLLAEQNRGSIGWSPAQYNIKPDYTSIYKVKTLYTEKELHAKYGEVSDQKPRVSQIMEESSKVNSNWKKAKFDIDSDLTNHGNLFYPRSKLHRHQYSKADHKPGALETGHADNFKLPEYPDVQYSIEQDQYLLNYPKSKLHKHDGEHAEHKPGAIEIGKTDYKIAKFNIDNAIAEKQYGLYHLISELHKRDSETIPHKEGAIEIGRADGFHGAQYSVDWDPIKNSQYGLFYNASDLKKKWMERSSQKCGIGGLGKTDSNRSLSTERKRKQKNAGVGNSSSNNASRSLAKTTSTSPSVSSRAGNSRNGLWPGFSTSPDSNGTISRNKLKESVGFSSADDYHVDLVKTNTRTYKGATTLDKQKKPKEDTTEYEVDAYLPRNFSPIGGSTIKRKGTKRVMLSNVSEGSSNSNIFKTQSSEKVSEHDTFSEDILSFARDSLEKRRLKFCSGFSGSGSSFDTPFEEKRVPRDSN